MIPRSIRNNNPFNIKKSSSRWLGKINGDDKVFETFDSLEHGIRAGIKLLLNYVKQGYNTPRKIIERFAPASENDTTSYIRFVCSPCFFGCDKVISDVVDFVHLCFRIIQYESGFTSFELSQHGITVVSLLNIFQKYNFKLSNYGKN